MDEIQLKKSSAKTSEKSLPKVMSSGPMDAEQPKLQNANSLALKDILNKKKK